LDIKLLLVYIIFILKKKPNIYIVEPKRIREKNIPKLPSLHSLPWARNLPFFSSKVKEE
jgi:Ni,Fe-hydrogenase maturation factor